MDSSASDTFQMSREDFYLFHSIDRRLYSILVLSLARDPVQSMHVIALWLWLEKVGFSKVVQKILAFPHTLINELADEAVLCLKCMSRVPIAGTSDLSRNEKDLMLKTVVDIDISFKFFYTNWFRAIEGVDKIVNHVCVRAFDDINELRRNGGQRTVKTDGGRVQPNSSNSASHLLIQQPVAAPGEFAGLRSVFTDAASGGMMLPSISNEHFFNQQVAAPSGARRRLGASDGLVLQSNSSSNLRFLGHQADGAAHHGMMLLPNLSNDRFFSQQARGPSGRARSIVFGDFENPGRMLLPNSSIDHLFSQQAAEVSEFAGLGISHDNGESYYTASNTRNDDDDDEVDKRTMFVTFSKGYPVREVELIEFFTRTFGECIQSLYMQDVTPERRQPLFARIVFLNASTVELVLSGGVTKAKFNINGKHVWARRFVPKRSMTAENGGNSSSSNGILDLISNLQDFHV